MWVEIDNVMLNLDEVTSIGVHNDEYDNEILVVSTKTGNIEFYDDCKTRYDAIKDILFGGKYYDYRLLSV